MRAAKWTNTKYAFLAVMTVISLLSGPDLYSLARLSADAPRKNTGPIKLGMVDFAISCAPSVRAEFNRGVAFLHSFWQDKAFIAFEHVASADPNCAIAYWGEAMTHFHQLLASPTAADIQAGAAELAKADQAQEKSPREAAYVEALHHLFDGYRPDLYLQQSDLYADAMAVIAKTYPHDLEAQVFYALALLASEPPNDPQLVNPRKALAILEPQFRKHPNHPGIAHYIIHACDNPQMAREGRTAARQYARIAPQVPHALHMPAHIFARLGLWQDDIESNLASKAAAEAGGLHHGAENRLHAMEFLEYAYLQTGRFEKAKAIVVEARSIQPTDVDPRYPNMWASVEARYPALLAIETKHWIAALQLKPIAGGSAASQEIILLAHAEAAAYLQDPEAAGETLRQLESLTATRLRSVQSAAQIEIHAWVDFTEGNLKDAITLLQPLAERQARIGKSEVEIPAREMLADMLLLNGQPAEALTQYQQSLLNDPNRFNALLGAFQAAERFGRKDLAARYARTLLANCPDADGTAVEKLHKVEGWEDRR